MEETLRRLNRERLICLAYLAVAVVLACLAAVSLFFAVSPSVHIGFTIPFIFFAVFTASLVYAIKSNKKIHTAYETDFRESAKRISMKDKFPECEYGGEYLTAADLAAAEIISFDEKAVFTESFRAIYEDIPFSTAYFKTEKDFNGLFFVFTYDAEFRKNARVRQRGFYNAAKAVNSSTDTPYVKYKTGNILFDYAFNAMAASSAEGKTVLTEPVLQPFLKIRENTAAKLSASFIGDRLYLILQNPKRDCRIPLLFNIRKEKLINETLSETQLAVSLAADLKLEKRIWKKHGSA
ncbi:MAG: DUF3137 domain-containing protein [Eubacteriales bacterium]|nr:DUF3137 domain-containing protein [Eubacteriales bacterium]